MIDPVMLSGIVRTTDTVSNPVTGVQNPGTSGFGELLTTVSRAAVTDIQSAETVSMQALQGEADARKVVDAVMSAERSLQTAIAIRDKIVTAYLEVSRMSI